MGVSELHPNILDWDTRALVEIDFSSRVARRRPIDLSPLVHAVKLLGCVLPVFPRWRQAALPLTASCATPDARCVHRDLLVTAPGGFFDIGVLLNRCLRRPFLKRLIEDVGSRLGIEKQ